jgi:hypothetical protein
MISPTPSQCSLTLFAKAGRSIPLRREKLSAASARAPHPIIPGFADFVTALHHDLSIPVGRVGMFMVGE